MKRIGKLLLILISVVSLFSCGKDEEKTGVGIDNNVTEYLFIINCSVPNQPYTISCPWIDGPLETRNTFEYHVIDKWNTSADCYLTCKNPQATLTVQRYVNGKREKTIYGKGSITFNLKQKN